MMLDLPNDLHEFLATGSQLKFDVAGTEIGRITLKSLDDIEESIIETFPGCQSIVEDPYEVLDGMYHIDAVNLVATSKNYDTEGLFCWLPRVGRFGSVDPEHGDIITFPGVTWSAISKAPVPYLDAQWGLSAEGERVYPWLYYPFVLDSDDAEFSPYPTTCHLHASQITPRVLKRHRLYDAFRERDLEAWVSELRANFPFSGVPWNDTELLSCCDCFNAESNWLDQIMESIPIIESIKNSGGFVKCPYCGIRFSPSDKDRFDDGTHLTCGQRINVLEKDAKSS